MEIIEHNSVDDTRLHWTRIEQTFQKQFDLVRENIVSHIFLKLYAHKAKLFSYCRLQFGTLESSYLKMLTYIFIINTLYILIIDDIQIHFPTKATLFKTKLLFDIKITTLSQVSTISNSDLKVL